MAPNAADESGNRGRIRQAINHNSPIFVVRRMRYLAIPTRSESREWRERIRSRRSPDSISEIRRVPRCRFRRSIRKQINLNIEARRNPGESINVRAMGGRFVVRTLNKCFSARACSCASGNVEPILPRRTYVNIYWAPERRIDVTYIFTRKYFTRHSRRHTRRPRCVTRRV